MSHKQSPRRITASEPIFWLVFCGLMMISLMAIGLQVVVGRPDSLNLWDEKLVTASRMAAENIDGSEHDRIVSDRLASTPDFLHVQRSLASAVAPIGPADRAYTLRKSPSGQLFIVADSDPKQVGPSFQPFDHPPSELIRAFDFGRPGVSWSAKGEGAPVRQAYSPICDASGAVTGVVVTQKASSAVLGSPIQNWVGPLIVVSAFMCLALSWCASAWLLDGRSNLFQALKTRFGRMALEGAVVLAVLASISLVYFRSITRDGPRRSHAQAAVAIKMLTDTTTLVDQVRSGVQVDPEVLKRHEASLSDRGFGWIAIRLRNLQAAATPTAVNDLANELLSKLAQEEARANETLAVAAAEEDAQQDEVLRIVFITGIVGVAALSLVRVTGSQENNLAEVTDERDEVMARYERVAEGMPVGLFVISNGSIGYTNSEWDSLFERGETDSADERLRKSVHAEDLSRVLAELSEAEAEGREFELSFRIRDSRDRAYHVQSKGSPLLDEHGNCVQLMAFTLDVTKMVEAQAAVEQTFSEIEHKNRLLSAALGELEANLENVVRSLVRAVEAKDPYTGGHSERVKQYSLWLGQAVGLSAFEMRILELGTLVHDIGKIGTPDAVLTKPGRLTDEEFTIIKLHPTFGVKILESISLFRDCLPIVRWHHEKLNGTGYPDGISGSQIPYLVRIATIADIYDAMTSTRAYRKGMQSEAVLRLMSEMVDNGELDAGLFATFADVINERGVIDQEFDQEVA